MLRACFEVQKALDIGKMPEKYCESVVRIKLAEKGEVIPGNIHFVLKGYQTVSQDS